MTKYRKQRIKRLLLEELGEGAKKLDLLQIVKTKLNINSTL